MWDLNSWSIRAAKNLYSDNSSLQKGALFCDNDIVHLNFYALSLWPIWGDIFSAIKFKTEFLKVDYADKVTILNTNDVMIIHL